MRTKITDTSKFEVITCPVCGREYLPCEIYLPNSFLGKAKHIERDNTTRKISSFFGKTMDKVEEFECWDCRTHFRVTANVRFFTEEVKEKSHVPYKTKLTLGFTLDEGDN